MREKYSGMCKVSIITVAYNAVQTIEDSIVSVLGQDYENIEYIIVDGASTDGTLDIIDRYKDQVATVISEADRGIYDAMNKGVSLATGDVVGLLNADDFYIHDKVISRIVQEFETTNAGAVFADLVYVDAERLDKVVRTYRSKHFKPEKFAYGWMPAHPTFFLKKEFYERFGGYKTDYKIAADYELLIRMLYVNQIGYSYIPEVLIRMRLGGVSTSSIRSNIILNHEILRACRENGINTNLFKIYSKYPKKLLELIRR